MKVTLGVLALCLGLTTALGVASAGRPSAPMTPPSGLISAPSTAFAKPGAPSRDRADSPAALSDFVDMRARALSNGPGLVGQGGPGGRLTAPQTTALAERCAPTAPASVLVSIVHVESGFLPLTIRVNGAHSRVLHPDSGAVAVEQAKTLIQAGRNIDLGLAQINSRNLSSAGLSVAEAFEPCRNLSAAAEILNRGYARALTTDRSNRPILQMAYSIYNTGNADSGLTNGYVAKVEAARKPDAQ
jgi:type IV secretion system protein VirB1